ncbi:hypothetical protein YC2023_053406 [Brassica napus]
MIMSVAHIRKQKRITEERKEYLGRRKGSMEINGVHQVSDSLRPWTLFSTTLFLDFQDQFYLLELTNTFLILIIILIFSTLAFVIIIHTYVLIRVVGIGNDLSSMIFNTFATFIGPITNFYMDAIEGRNRQKLDGRNITMNEAQSRGDNGGGGGGRGGRSGGYRSGGGGGCGDDGGRREYGYNGGGWWRWLLNLHPQNLEHKTSSTRSSSTKP